MADFNKDEANKALEIAVENTKNEKYEDALKSANEARLMNPELPDIKRLVTLLQVLSANPDVTHYEILGVEETANENEIRLAFRKLAVNLNPDTNNFPKASEAFHRIFEAMSVLLNDRLKYDSDLAVARGARTQVAEIEAILSKDFIVDREALSQAVAYPLLGKEVIVDREALGRAVAEQKAPKALGWAVAEWKAPDCTFDGMISSSEYQAAFLKEKAAFKDAEFDAALGNDVVVAPDWRAHFDVFDNTFDGMISSSELKAAFEAFDVLDTFDGMISSSELQAAFEAYDKEPQSTTHHPSFQKRFVCSSNEVAGQGTKRSNTTQSSLTHPVPKKKMDGQGPLFFK